MPPKDKKKGKKGKKKKPPPEPEPEPIPMDDEEEDADIDLVNDINAEFTESAQACIQKLMEHNRTYEASKITKYLGIITKMHTCYVAELKDNNILRPKIMAAENKIRMALGLCADSDESFALLREALEDAWRESDHSQHREQEVQDKLQEIMIKCASFENKEIADGDDDAEFGSLAKYKNIILRERDRLNGENIDLDKRLQMQRYYAESLEFVNKNLDDNVGRLTSKNKMLEVDKGSLEVKIRNLYNILDDQRENTARTQLKLDATARELSETAVKLNRRNAAYERQRLVLEKFKNDNAVQARQLSRNEEDMTQMRKGLAQNEETIKNLKMEDKVKGGQIDTLTAKLKKEVQEHGVVSSKLYKMNRQMGTLNEEIVRLKNAINSYEKDLLSAAGKFDDMRRLKDNVTRERDGLRSDVAKLNNQVVDLRHIITLNGTTIDNLRMDINKLHIRVEETKILISKVEKERDEMTLELQTLNERIEYYQDQLQLKVEVIAQQSEKLTARNKALTSVRKQLETVHSEKMVLRRALDQVTQERDSLRSTNSKINHQIAQFTIEVSHNQNTMNALKLKIEHLSNEKKELQSEVTNRENQLAGVRKDLKVANNKNANLIKTICEDEKKFLKLANELDETRKEKNLVGLQMVRRNDEIIKLKEKMINISNALDQGQTQYNQRLVDIRILKTEITNLQTERDCLIRAIKSTADMRREVIRLHRALNQERIKVRALTEDLKAPTGVHRWRVLKSEDPAKLDLLTRVQVLQKRLLKQATNVTNIERKIEEKDEVINHLKMVVDNLPAGNAKEKLMRQQRVNRVQARQIKSLKAQLALEFVEVNVHKCFASEFHKLMKDAKDANCENVSIDPIKVTKLEDCDDCPFEQSEITDVFVDYHPEPEF